MVADIFFSRYSLHSPFPSHPVGVTLQFLTSDDQRHQPNQQADNQRLSSTKIDRVGIIHNYKT